MASSFSHQLQGVLDTATAPLAAAPAATHCPDPPSQEGLTVPVHDPRGIQIEDYNDNTATCRSFWQKHPFSLSWIRHPGKRGHSDSPLDKPSSEVDHSWMG